MSNLTLKYKLINKHKTKTSANLLQYRSNVAQGERAELAVLEKVVQILFKHLKHQAGVTLVLEAFI